MPRNHNLSLNLIDTIDSRTTSLVHIYENQNEIVNEINYLSKGQYSEFSLNEKKPNIMLLTLHQHPFLIYTVNKDLLDTEKLKETLSGFYISNKDIPNKTVWVGKLAKSIKDSLGNELNLEFKIIDN